MKNTFIFILSMLCSSFVLAEQKMVPGIGTVSKNTLVYNAMEAGGSPVKRTEEVLKVNTLMAGRPVFSGEVFGQKGKIVESTVGVIVITDDCEDKVEASYLLPPVSPNQCGWHICEAPPVGKTLEKKMIVFAKLYACEAKVGTYKFTSKSEEVFEGKKVTVGEAQVSFGIFSKTFWTSYVQNGIGEIYAESSGRKTIYNYINVNHVPYVPTTDNTNVTDAALLAKEESFTDCDYVAFGDSLTEGMGASKTESYPAQLSKLTGLKICNLGISGNTSKVAKERLMQVLELKPKVVIITLGANDVFQGLSTKETKENIREIVSELVRNKTQVVMLGFDGVSKDMPDNIKETMSGLKTTCQEEGATFLPDAFVGVLNKKENLSSDGMHPNAKGYAQLAQNVFEQTKHLLK